MVNMVKINIKKLTHTIALKIDDILDFLAKEERPPKRKKNDK